MEESKRQKQVGKLVQQELSDIFQREGVNVIGGGMVSITSVTLTPDLLEARVLLSFFQVAEPNKLLFEIRERTGEWRNELGRRVRNQLRRIPELQFYIDDSLERAFKMEELFTQIKQERESRSDDKSTDAAS
jgi:ribosome-binding factor A